MPNLTTEGCDCPPARKRISPIPSQLRARRQIQEVNLPRISGWKRVTPSVCPNMEKVASIQGERSKSVHSRLTERKERTASARKRRHLSPREALQISSFHFAIPSPPLTPLPPFLLPSPVLLEEERDCSGRGRRVRLSLPLTGILAISLYLRAEEGYVLSLS